MSGHLMGIIGLAAVCLHIGDFLITKLEKYKPANKLISDYSLKISTHWDIQRAVWKKLQKLQEALDHDVSERLAQILERLQRILDRAVATLSRYSSSSISSPSGLHGVRYSLLDGKVSESLETEIAEWESLFKKRLVLLDATTNRAEPQEGTNKSTTFLNTLPIRIPILRPTDYWNIKDHILDWNEFHIVQPTLFEHEVLNTGMCFVQKHPNFALEQ
jgi:hypothetical protein